jgi:hypothetical protein
MLNRQLTPEESKEVCSILDLCEDQFFFKFDDLIIKGLPVDIIKDYVAEKPTKKFRTWLIDNGHSVNITTEK